MRLFGLNIRFPRHRHSSVGQSLEAQWLADRLRGSDDDAVDYLKRQNLRENPEAAFVGWAYVAIMRIGRYGSSCPWEVMRGGDIIPDHPLAELLHTPNPYQTSEDLIRQTLLSQELWGQAFWIIERGVRKAPAELWAVSPASMRIGRLENGMPVTWQQTKSDGRVITYPDEDVVWFRTEAPGAMLSRRSPLTAADAAIQADLFIMRHYSYFFEHGASPLFAISTPNNLSEADFTKFRAEWQRNYEGLKRWFRPMLLEGGATVQQVGAEPSMAWLQLRTQLREEILAVFDCPPAIAGIFQNANYGVSIAEQRKMFWSQALKPRLEDLSSNINRQLAPQVADDGGEMFWQYAQVPELQTDFAEAVQSMAPLASLLMSGAIDQKQAQSIMVKAGLLDDEEQTE